MTDRRPPLDGGSADVLLYVQHLLGIGHLRRAALIARALSRAGLRVVFVSGGMPLPGLELGGARLIQLPPLRARDASFSALVDEQGHEVDRAWKAVRAEKLFDVFWSTRPRALLIELFPFGRRQMAFELLPLLDAARAATPRPRILCSLRDVLTEQTRAEKTAWTLETFGRYFDLALVHGDPDFLPLERSFPRAREIAKQLRYTGYVVEPPPNGESPGEGSDEVIVSAGGGAAAGPLLEAALDARALTPLREATWRLLAGHNFPDAAFEDLRARAPDGVTVERARDDFRSLLGRARLSISQAGYNTLLEVLAAGPPAVAVPFAARDETEQSLRARAFAERGALTLVEEATLSPETLAAGIAEALTRGPHRDALAGLDMAGAGKTAEIVSDLIAIVPS